MHIAHSSKKSRFLPRGGSAAAARPHIAKAKATPHAMRSNMPGLLLLTTSPEADQLGTYPTRVKMHFALDLQRQPNMIYLDVRL